MWYAINRRIGGLEITGLHFFIELQINRRIGGLENENQPRGETHPINRRIGGLEIYAVRSW